MDDMYTSTPNKLGISASFTSFVKEPSKELARIGPDGILHFTVDATDENAQRFIECLEQFFKKRITGIDVKKSPPPC